MIFGGYLGDMAEKMGQSRDTVKQVEDAVNEAIEVIQDPEPAQSTFFEVEHWDEGGGKLIPKEFAASIVSLSQKLAKQTNISLERKDMLDGMAKKFAVGVLLTSAMQHHVMQQAKEL